MKCANCNNTARMGFGLCTPCAEAEDREAEREARSEAHWLALGDFDMAISDLAHDLPTQRAFEALRDVLRTMP